MRTLGLIGGMSWESTATYYRLLNRMARERLGGLHSAELLLWSVDFAGIADLQHAGDWGGITARLAEAGRRLAGAGAEAILICTNTMHKMAGEIEAAAGVPVLHIADATAEAIRRVGVRRPALLATSFTMEQDFYTGRLRDRHGIDALIPDAPAREMIHRVIYDELCRGVVRAESKAAYLAEIERLRANGADGVILGCTEIGLLIGQDDTDLPVFDTTPIHAAAAMDFALGA